MDLYQLKNIIDRRLGGSNDQSVAREILIKISAEGGISSLIRSIVHDEHLLEEISSRSCEHANGFEKITLIDAGRPKYMLRLHVWWAGTGSNKPSDIHNHAWNFSSTVLLGSLRVKQFEESQTGEVKYHYVCQASGFNPVMNLINETKVECLFDGTFAHGSVYSLSRSVLHCVERDPLINTVTLILQGPFMSDTSDVYPDLPLDTKPGGELPMNWMRAVDLKKKLIRLLKLIGDGVARSIH